MSIDAAQIDEAAKRLTGVVATTPLERNERLSVQLGADIWLKREDLQSVRSYKVRGAYNLIAQLDDAQRAAGVVTASAGNHAQGVAYACSALGVRGRVYLPDGTPRQKRDRIATLGGEWIEIVIGGETYDAASEAATEYATVNGATLVPAFDDERTIIGQGTVVHEIVEQLGHAPDILVLPVGGGGLLAGVLTWLAENAPEVKVIGVEPVGATSMAAALEAGGPVTVENMDTFVDGAAVARVGALTYPIVAAAAPELVSVEPGRVCSEMLEMYQTDGIIAEPAGALATAALGGPSPAIVIPPGSSVVCIVSGGNNDVSRYAEIIERALVYEGRKHYFLVDFPQEPGALRRFLDEVLGPDDDITLFEYTKRSNRETGPALVGIELARASDLPALLQRMEAAPPQIERIEAGGPLFRYIL